MRLVQAVEGALQRLAVMADVAVEQRQRALATLARGPCRLQRERQGAGAVALVDRAEHAAQHAAEAGKRLRAGVGVAVVQGELDLPRHHQRTQGGTGELDDAEHAAEQGLGGEHTGFGRGRHVQQRVRRGVADEQAGAQQLGGDAQAPRRRGQAHAQARERGARNLQPGAEAVVRDVGLDADLLAAHAV